MTFDVKGKTVLVTGANRGIGKAILEDAIKRGAKKVYAAVRDISSAKPLVDEYGDQVSPVHLDLDQTDSIAKAATSASDADLVVNNAGILKTSAALDESAIEDLQSEMNVNVYGLMRVSQAFAPVLKANGGGALVQLNSVASVRTFPDFTTYCASKAASYAVTQGLRASLADQGTSVVSVHPGPIATDMAHDAGFEEADPPEVVASAIFDALEKGEFLVWPDAVAKQIGEQYQGFADNVVAKVAEGSPA